MLSMMVLNFLLIVTTHVCKIVGVKPIDCLSIIPFAKCLVMCIVYTNIWTFIGL